MLKEHCVKNGIWNEYYQSYLNEKKCLWVICFWHGKSQTVFKYWDIFLGRKSFSSTVIILRERWKNKIPLRLMHSWIMQRDHFKSEPGARSGEASAPALGWLLNLAHIFCRTEFLWKHKLFTTQHRQDEKKSLLYETRIYFPILWHVLKISDTDSYKGQTPGFQRS